MGENLLKSILSMDAYNKGYGQGIKIDDTQIGQFLVGNNSHEIMGLEPNGEYSDGKIGFYAQIYEYDGEKVISFRGTDDGKDIIHGWTLGAGIFQSEQGQMAIEFYKQVAGTGNHLTANISLTGHSLGGGLAGYVASLYGKEAHIFDSMNYQSALNTTQSTITNGSPINLSELIYGSTPPWEQNLYWRKRKSLDRKLFNSLCSRGTRFCQKIYARK